MSKFAYVTNTDSNSISVVDLQTSEEVKQIDIGDSPRGAMAIDKKRGLGFVSNCAGNTVSVIDLFNESEIKKITVGLAPRGVEISEDCNWLFVANSGSSSVSIVDLEIHEEVCQISVQRNPRQLSISPDGIYVNVPNFGSDSVSIIEINYTNMNDSKVIATIPLGKNAKPYHVYPSQDGQYLFTANTFNHSVSVISFKEKKVIRTISCGYNPRAVITEPSGKYLFVSAEASNALSVIDRNTWQEIKRIPVGPTPRGMAVNEDNNTIIVTAFDRSTVSLQSIYDYEHDTSQDKMTVVSIDTLSRIGNLPTGLGACSLNILETDSLTDGYKIIEKHSLQSV